MYITRLIPVLLFCCALTVNAGIIFNDPVSVGEGIHSISTPQLEVNSKGEPFIVFSGIDDSGKRAIFYYALSVEFTTFHKIALQNYDCFSPAFILGPMEEAHILFEGRNESTSDIYYITNKGGPFQNPVNITNSIGAGESHPALFLQDDNSGIKAVWEQEKPDGPSLIYSPDLKDSSVLVEGGQDPRGILSEKTGSLQLVYRIQDKLYYLAENEVPLEIQTVSEDVKYDVGIVPKDKGLVHLVYSTGEGIRYISVNNGVCSDSVMAAPGGNNPVLKRGLADDLYLVYLRSGSVLFRKLMGTFFGPEEILMDLQPVITGFAFTCDSNGFFHLLTVCNDCLWYQNTIPGPEPEFSASSLRGSAPLFVKFSNESTGNYVTSYWDFGDGETSTSPSPGHLFETQGVYSVSLSVTGPGGGNKIVKSNFITVLPPENFLSVSKIKVWPGQKDVFHPIIAVHPDHLLGFQVALVFQDDYISKPSVDIEDTTVGKLSPEFTSLSIEDGEDNEINLLYALIINTSPPFDGRTLVPSTRGDVLIYMVYNVNSEMPVGGQVTFELRNGIGTPPINNVFSVVGPRSVFPTLSNGTAEATEPPEFAFLRGDSNLDGFIDLADAIFVLGYLFGDSNIPFCFDACDVNDSGIIDIGDGIYILDYLFSWGPPPAYPFPNSGEDPTADDLRPCEVP